MAEMKTLVGPQFDAVETVNGGRVEINTVVLVVENEALVPTLRLRVMGADGSSGIAILDESAFARLIEIARRFLDECTATCARSDGASS